MNRNRIFAICALCVLLSASSLFSKTIDDTHYRANSNYREWLAESRSYRERYSFGFYEEAVGQGLTIEEAVGRDLTIDEYYRHPLTHTAVIEFFVRLTGSERISLPIIYHAERNNIPLSLAFSVSWVESKYKPHAYNQNPTTIDRGLFQLNSASFRALHLEEFFNPEINSLHAAKHLRYCLDKGDNDIETALAIYNAGLGRVRRGSIPASTQVYVSRVVEYRAQLLRRFGVYIQQALEQERETQQS